MAMGIDQEIQRRMDAYRGNPQALQQRYQMSQQLLDLLALQKLKAEKDAVARQMQAQMQQRPGTVAQQMEQEMLGRTKQEMAQQVGGVLQQQTRQQQQNMARMAQAAARPQGGLGSLAPQTAQSAPRMAGGGIVAFAQGGMNDPMARLDAQLEALQAELKSLGPYSTFGVVPAGSEEKYARIEELESQIQDLERRRPLLERMIAGEPLPPTRTGLSPPRRASAAREGDVAALQELMTPVAATTAATSAAPAGPSGAGVGPLLDAPPYFPTGRSTATGALRALGKQGGAAAVPDIAVIEPVLDLTNITAPEVGEAESAAGLRSLLQERAKEAIPDMTQLMEQYGSALGQKERMERRQSRIDELAALDRAQLDPERARKDRLMQVLAAAGGASNIGTMGARMANAAVSSRIRQEQDERARLRQRLAMADEMDLADLDISKESLKNALGVIDSAKARQIQAMDALGNLSRAEIARKEANAKLELEAGKANNDNVYREYTAAREQAEAALARQDAGIEQLTEVARLMQEAYSADLERRMDQLQRDARYIELQDKAKRTAEEEREFRKMETDAVADAAAYANMNDYFAIMKQLNERALQNAGISLNNGR